MSKKSIADLLNFKKSLFENLQIESEKPFKLLKAELAGVSLRKQLAGISNKNDSIFKPLAGMSNKIDDIFKPSDIIKNSPLVKMEKMNKQFAELFKFPNVMSELSTRSIISISPSLNFPNIIVPRPIEDSIFPLVPEKRRTPPPNTDSSTITDEVYEKRIPPEQRSVPLPDIDHRKIVYKVLIVGGLVDSSNQIVARFIEQLGFEAIILSEQPNGGRTKFEKFKAYTNVDFVITLLTPDDVGRTKDNPYDELKPRPSQDTIFGLGYLCNHLRPEQMCTLYTEKIELPSLLEGYIHLSICSSDSWKLKLIKEMKFAGLRIDGNKLLRT